MVPIRHSAAEKQSTISSPRIRTRVPQAWKMPDVHYAATIEPIKRSGVYYITMVGHETALVWITQRLSALHRDCRAWRTPGMRYTATADPGADMGVFCTPTVEHKTDLVWTTLGLEHRVSLLRTNRWLLSTKQAWCSLQQDYGLLEFVGFLSIFNRRLFSHPCLFVVLDGCQTSLDSIRVMS
jgi:hypothetical protein